MGAIQSLLMLAVLTLPSAAALFAVGAAPPTPEPQLAPRDPIFIGADHEFTPANGVIGGSGVPDDPYVIAGWEIMSFQGDAAVWIRNTTAHFEVRDVRMSHFYGSGTGIVLQDVTNGVVERASATNVGTGMLLEGVTSTIIRNGTFAHGGTGIRLSGATDVALIGNRFANFWAWAIQMEGSRSLRLEENIGGPISGEKILDVHIAGNRLAGAASFTDGERIVVRSNEHAGALRLTRTRNATVEANRFANGGLFLDGNLREHYTSHTIASNLVNGRDLRFVTGCTDLEVTGDSVGQLVVADCSRVRAANLTLNNTVVGIEMAFVQDAIVEGNVVSEWGEWGIRLHDVANATIRNNTVGYRWGGSITLVRSQRVTIYQNNFLQSNVPYDSGGGGNVWNASYPFGGNYWDLYMGPDICGGEGQATCGAGDGFGDVPHDPAAGVVDRYPRTGPFGMDDRKPVASMTLSGDRIPAGEGLMVWPDGSHDPQGGPVGAWWDFGDGHREQGGAVFHWYPRPGTYTVTLKITDEEFLSAILSRNVTVLAPPVALFTVSRSAVLVGESITFNASMSSSPETRIVSYEWNFGDGTLGSGAVVDHAYASPGAYEVLLVVWDADNVPRSAQGRIRVFDPIALVPYYHSARFVVPLPQGWPVHRDVLIGEVVVEVVAVGPDDNGIQTSLIVDTDLDPTASETTSYLEAVVSAAISAAQRDDPGASLLGPPTYRTISDHAGVVFGIRYSNDPVVQRFALVVSEDLGRYWILLLTTTPALYGLMNDTFEGVVDGFEITLRPLVLRPYQHPTAGFRLPIPEGWAIQEDMIREGTTVELVLVGPVSGGLHTNILVDTDADPTVRETDSYLLARAYATIEEIRRDNPTTSVVLTEDPMIETIAGHRAVTFGLVYGTGESYQSAALVVSEAHRRHWLLILTTDGQSLHFMQEGFRRMLQGFEITLAPDGGSSPPVPVQDLSMPIIFLGVLVGVVAALLLVVFAVTRSRPRTRFPPPAPLPWTPPPIVPASPVPMAWPRFCPACGHALETGARFCGRCGSAISPSPAAAGPGPPPRF